MHGRRRWREDVLRHRRGRKGGLGRHGRGSVESAACLQLFYDVLCDLSDELRRYIV